MGKTLRTLSFIGIKIKKYFLLLIKNHSKVLRLFFHLIYELKYD